MGSAFPRNIAHVVDISQGTKRIVLPASVDDVPLLVLLLLDQGSIGDAAVGFTDHIEGVVHHKFEKIHRLIRDIEGPFGMWWRGVT